MFECRKLSIIEAEHIYTKYMTKDFPKNELKPFAMIKKSVEKGECSIFGCFCGEELQGYAFFIVLGKICLMDYFAVLSDRRGAGIGSAFLKLLKKEMSDAEMIICEADDPDYAKDMELEIRKRRVSFYLRNGFSDTGVRANVFGAEFRLLEFEKETLHSWDEISNGYSRLYRSFLSEKAYNKFFHIHEKIQPEGN